MAEEIVNDWKDGKYILPLEKPVPDVEKEGVELKSLTFREPTGDDMIEVGNPIIWNPANDEQPYRVDTRVMGAMIARVSAQPPSIIRKMSTKDMVRASNVLGGFFLPF